MQNQRLAPNSKPRTPVARRDVATPPSTGSGAWLLLVPLLFCGVMWVVMQWMESASTPPSVQTVPLSQGISTSVPTQAAPSTVYVDTTVATPTPSYNPDPWGTLATVLETQGDGILLLGGAVLGGIVLMLVAARHVTRLPADPLATGLARTLTLLENDHRAGNLTPQRALEVARLVLAEQAHEHDEATRTRTQEYEQAVARLSASHADTVTAIRTEATLAVQEAQAQVSQADTRTQAALQRVANTEAQVAQLSRDLATIHEELVTAQGTIRTQAEEITNLTQMLEEVTDTLEEWQTAHHDLVSRHTALNEERDHLAQDLATTQATLTSATQRAEAAVVEAESLRTAQTHLTSAKETLTAQLKTTERELTRLRVLSLRELPLVIPDREGDLVPYMAKLVEFIRGTTLDSGSAKGERTQKPILSSWRDIRRLFQVLKGVGVRLAVPAHHVPQWATMASEEEKAIGGDGEAGAKGELTEIRSNVQASAQALTESAISAHNGAPTDLSTSQEDVLALSQITKNTLAT